MLKGILISGTDTNVGKTYITMGLINAALKEDIRIGVMKPVETGCRLYRDKLVPQDAIRLMNTAGMKDINLVNPYRFKYPVAPYVAQILENRHISIKHIKQVYNKLAREYELVIVEGAGGLLVPITKNFSYADLAKELSLPVIIVAVNKLGVINHILLTIDYIKTHKLNLLGIILNNIEKKDDIAKKTNVKTISSMIGKLFIGEVHFNNVVSDIDLYKNILKLITL